MFLDKIGSSDDSGGLGRRTNEKGDASRRASSLRRTPSALEP